MDRCPNAPQRMQRISAMSKVTPATCWHCNFWDACLEFICIIKKIHRRKDKKLKVIRPKVGGRRRKSRYSLAVKEETIKRFREFYADNDFQTHDTFPNSKLPLPGMYMYLTLRGSFVESKIKSCSSIWQIWAWQGNQKSHCIFVNFDLDPNATSIIFSQFVLTFWPS